MCFILGISTSLGKQTRGIDKYVNSLVVYFKIIVCGSDVLYTMRMILFISNSLTIKKVLAGVSITDSYMVSFYVCKL